MQIEKANKEDIEDIMELNKLFYIDIPEFRWGTLRWVENELDNYFIIKDDNQTYGAICLLLTKDGYCVETIAVQEKYQRKGIGRKLINFAKAYTKNKGQAKLKVESFCEYNADGFYEKCGFTKEQEVSYFQDKPYYKLFIDL